MDRVEDGKYQLSDIALKWMIEKFDQLPGDQPQWNPRRDGFLNNFDYEKEIKAPIHTTMSFKDSSFFNVLLWWFIGTFVFLAVRRLRLFTSFQAADTTVCE